MFGNYFKSAIRILTRDRISSIINIAGLSLGLSCAMLILLYVKDELSFDRFHKNARNIYRIVSTGTYGKNRHGISSTGFLQGPRFAAHVPGIRTFVRVQSATEEIRQDSKVISRPVLYVDPNFFNVFTFPLLQGNPRTCLTDPHSIVMSQSAALRQFGTTRAIGKIVAVKQNGIFIPYSVTAVILNCPQNSSIPVDILLPIHEPEANVKNKAAWFSWSLSTFVVLDPNSSPRSVAFAMDRFYRQDAGDTFKVLTAKYGGGGSMEQYFLQPLTDIHLDSELPIQNALVKCSNPMYSFVLSAIALFVLLLACINFINLTIARSVKRAKEIGIRKIAGASRPQLILQFLGESFFLCFIAFSFAYFLMRLLLPAFNTLANKNLSVDTAMDTQLVAGYGLLFLFTGLLAGLYPALVLSRYQPVTTLYNRFDIKGDRYGQKALVVLQFTLAGFMMIITFCMYAQFDFLTGTSLGYNDSNIFVIRCRGLSRQNAGALKADLLKYPGIVDVAPNNVGQYSAVVRLTNDTTIGFSYADIDEAYFRELAISFVEGRNFSAGITADSSNAVIVNQNFVKSAGWKDPIGQKVDFLDGNKRYYVIGVIKDYHYRPMTQNIGLQLFSMRMDHPYSAILVRIKPGAAIESLSYIQQCYRRLLPMDPWSYTFLNEDNRKAYETEARWKQIMLFGAILTIFISCVGLFGLSVLSAESRTKEIGIRKVLGASVPDIVAGLCIDFLKLVALSLLIALPLGWMASNKWLQNYPYRIAPSGWMFGCVAVIVILIALATVSFQAIRVAIANPVKSLR